MPRRRRYWENHACYHITHRCHERRFLFRFIKYRDLYRRCLFEATQRFNVSVLSYVVTSNHTHLLLATGESVGGLRYRRFFSTCMVKWGSTFNLARGREGSFWSNRFHATWVQSGVHLRRCLFYIDMNMVRAGVVDRPTDWAHCSAYDLASSRRRYRIVDRERLLERLEIEDWETYLHWYDSTLADILRQRLFMVRQSFWSRSAAVGDASGVVGAATRSGMKRFELGEVDIPWLEPAKTIFASIKNQP